MPKNPPASPADDPYGFHKKLTITAEEAFDIFMAMAKPGITACWREVKAKGHDISPETIRRWAKRNNWLGRLRMAQVAADAIPDGADVAKLLKVEATWMTPEYLRGVQLRIAQRMALQIENVPLNTPDDFHRMVSVLNEMDAIIHRHRGDIIGGHAGNGKSTPAAPVALDEFRAWKANGGSKESS